MANIRFIIDVNTQRSKTMKLIDVEKFLIRNPKDAWMSTVIACLCGNLVKKESESTSKYVMVKD